MANTLQTTNHKVSSAQIVHIGVGAFHRSHQAYYFDKLLEAGHTNFGIIGVNLRKVTHNISQRLLTRNNAYVLKTIDLDGSTDYREIRSIYNILDWEEHRDAVEHVLISDTVTLMTITVTESGYSIDKNRTFNKHAPEIQEELTGKNISTIYAFLRIALHHRRKTCNTPITILCCDNIINNGQVLQQCFYEYLALFKDHTLLSWVRENVTFPSSVVDRITPSIDDSASTEVQRMFAINNDATVVAEEFNAWIIEDNFINERPPLDTVGVTFTTNVHQYEKIKILILNAGHSSICYFGALKGHEYFDRAISDETLNSFYDMVQHEETIPVIGENLPVDIHTYQKVVKQRLGNCYIRDLISRICMDGTNKIGIFILPTIVKCFEQNIIPKHNIKIIASWYLFMRSYAQGNISFEYIDPKWEQLKPFVAQGKEHEFATLSFLWGDVPETYPQFSDILYKHIITMEVELWSK